MDGIHEKIVNLRSGNYTNPVTQKYAGEKQWRLT
jgi:hypothetical protein